jgi:transcription elongation GreA/GreB family factor
MTTTRTSTRSSRSRRKSRAVSGPFLTREGIAGLTSYVERRESELRDLRDLMGDPERDERVMLDAERLLGEIDAYHALLAQAEVLDDAEVAGSPVVVLGSVVRLRFADGDVETVRLVHPSEAFLDDERVSVDAPLARALMGLTAGDKGEIQAPAGRVKFTVQEVGRSLVTAA